MPLQNLEGQLPAVLHAMPAEAYLPTDAVLFGQTPLMSHVSQTVEKVAATRIPVLVCGESGTGKELIAQRLHSRSPWAEGPLVRVNCPAIPGTLLESELFGFERGAFTGAYAAKRGRVEMAEGGTLFLDEIGELDPVLQSKLLQLLQDGQFNRLGSSQERTMQVRVVCATNRNLAEEIENGSFRRDLFYRINTVTIQLPPLRERLEDLPALLDYFLDVYRRKYHRTVSAPSGAVMRALRTYAWPGNIRQLENIVKRYVVLESEEVFFTEILTHSDLELDSGMNIDHSMSLKQATRQAVKKLERCIIYKALQANNWNRKRAAGALKISYRSMLSKMKENGISLLHATDE